MKKPIFALSLFALLAGCGGGGGDSTVLASLQVGISGSQGGGTVGRSISVSGGANYTCSQTPGATPNPPECRLANPTNGATDSPLIFTNLPTGQTYIFSEAAANNVQPAPGSCTITIVDSTHTDPASPYFCTLGDIQSQQLNLTISIQ